MGCCVCVTDLPLSKHIAFFKANCFCPVGWIQLADSFAQPTRRFGECVRLSTSPSSWLHASQSCRSLANGKAFLVSEFSEFKHQFNVDYVRNFNSRLVSYHIGLSFNTSAGTYLWEEEFNSGTRIKASSGYAYHLLSPLFQGDDSGYQPWFGGVESHATNGNAVRVMQFGRNTFWHNIHKSG